MLVFAHMSNDDGGREAVYEIGYLVGGAPEEEAPAAEAVKGAISAAAGEIVAEEAPRRERLAYSIRKKTVSGSYDSHEQASFGWVKFAAKRSAAESVKKSVEAVPAVIRSILVSTVRENTYLGKRAPAYGVQKKVFGFATASSADPVAGEEVRNKEVPVAAHASLEEMDKSIDEMVKGA